MSLAGFVNCVAPCTIGGDKETVSGAQAKDTAAGKNKDASGNSKPSAKTNVETRTTETATSASSGIVGWLKRVYVSGGGNAPGFQQGGVYEVNQMGDPVNPNYPGVGVAQVAAGAVLIVGVAAVAPEVIPIARVVIRGRRAVEEDSVPQVGGPHSEVQGVAGNESHHMPANSVSSLSKNKGPAISMRKNDHKETASWGSSRDARAYRAEQAERIKNGDFRGAQNMDIEDIQPKF